MKKLREELVRIHKKNYRQNLKLVRENLGDNPGVEKYEREYLRYLKNYEEISNKAELIKKVLAADLVFHGDYHTLKQSQHSVIRVLRAIKEKREIILCLEMFHAADQKTVDRFMAGKLPEKAFLDRIEYTKKWPFRWENWRPIIEFCRQNQIPILGINTESKELSGIEKLRERDRFSARIIANAPWIVSRSDSHMGIRFSATCGSPGWEKANGVTIGPRWINVSRLLKGEGRVFPRSSIFCQ